jgi:hypothetical protein
MLLPESHGMRIAASVVACVLAIGLASAQLEAQGQPAGYVKVVKGAATIVRSGAARPARPGDAVYQNDGLRTGSDGRLGVTLKDDTRVSLGPDSEIDLSEFKFSPAEGQLGLVMKLLHGVAAYVTGRIGELRPDAVRIETPATIVGVRGTFIVIRSEG